MLKKIILLTILIVSLSRGIRAQTVEKITKEPIELGEKDAAKLLKDQIPSHVQIVGLGEVASFSKEPKHLNNAIAAYLVNERGFKSIAVPMDNWILRPLNDYLAGKDALDKDRIDSLVKEIFGHTVYCTSEFVDLLRWVKAHNLKNRGEAVNVIGSGASTKIPAGYFLAKYIYPADKEAGARLSKKWAAANNSDSAQYNDIEDWYRKAIQNPSQKEADKLILLSCKEDVDHNSSIDRYNALNQTDVDKAVAFYASTCSDDVLKNAEQHKVIFYCANDIVANETVSIAGVKAVSVGGLLSQKIKDQYYVCLTDFEDSAFAFRAHLQTKRFEVDTVKGNLETKALFQKSDHFILSRDAQVLKNYLPRSISPISGDEQSEPIFFQGEQPAFDALFIFKRLSPSAYLLQKG